MINLTQPGATALINVNTATILSIGPMYMNLSGSATAAGIMWNLPLATGLNVTDGRRAGRARSWLRTPT